MVQTAKLKGLLTLFICCFALTGRADDFSLTGFWKENCNEPYGLQIKPYKAHLYTIEFCGPGDPYCRQEPDPTTATPIIGDKDYTLLAPDRLQVNYTEQYQPVYIRCSQDPHPFLTYGEYTWQEQVAEFAIPLLIHLFYLLFATVIYRAFSSKWQEVLPSGKSRLYRTALASLLFAPGMLVAWPFVMPTFAMLGLIFALVVLSPGGWVVLPFALFYTLGPMLICWGLLFAIASYRAKRQHTDIR